ncbi:type III polyketide synthase B [Physcomitrium patens]|uniref:Chalcone synthase n=1 Tax=Physcomitrium patens TaxID=3218 RepID=A9TSD3_PHYPA|nr:type III polyketide synthase B-like [Physcomitrium patens]PNR60779.1 hypothetical protein PHYPA_003572 [Physcomitrium patens]|eukprot:XP_024358417.1 type III polyketide synthase B-like [Physcomitrella patens]
MASRRVEAAFDGQAVELGATIPAANGNGTHQSIKVPGHRQVTPGKTTIMAIGRAVPANTTFNDGLADHYIQEFNLQDPVLQAKLRRLCETTTVKTRYLVVNKEILDEHPEFLVDGAATVSQRLAITGEAVTQLGHEAATAAIKEWGRPASEITHLVYVSSSEIRLPGGDLYLAQLLGLRSDVNRVMLYMLGCYGGASGIRVAKDLAENNPGSRVLLITSECTLIGYKSLSPDRPYDLVGAALFGDGAAAMIMGKDPIPVLERAFFELDWAGQSFIPGTNKTIDGRLSEEGISFKLGRELPKLIESNIQGFCDPILKRAGGLKYNDIFWAVHPGGPAILNAVQKQLDLAPEKLQTARQVLRDYGNISSSTCIYVLDYMRHQSLKLKEANDNVNTEPEWGLLLAFGPGVTIEGALLRNLC